MLGTKDKIIRKKRSPCPHRAYIRQKEVDKETRYLNKIHNMLSIFSILRIKAN